jgi:hypothetical protein
MSKRNFPHRRHFSLASLVLSAALAGLDGCLWLFLKGSSHGCHAHAHSDPHTNTCAHSNPYTNSNTHPHANSDPHTHGNAHADTYSHANSDAYTHSDTYSHAHSNSNTHANTDPDAHPDSCWPADYDPGLAGRGHSNHSTSRWHSNCHLHLGVWGRGYLPHFLYHPLWRPDPGDSRHSFTWADYGRRYYP